MAGFEVSTEGWTIVSRSGDISCDYFYRRITNASREDVRELRPDREGFLTEPESYHPRYAVLDSTQPGLGVRVQNASPYVQTTVIDGVPIRLWVCDNTLEFVPPLRVGQHLTLYREYDAKETEAAAFTEAGTYAGIRVFYPTRQIVQRLAAPPHFRIELLDSLVVNDSGTRIDRPSRVGLPSLAHDGTQVEWRVLYPRPTHRYIMRYRLAALAPSGARGD